MKTVATPRPARAAGLFLALGLLCLGTLSGPVHAEGEATNPAVRERMALMKDIGRNLKSIADMVQQKAPFDSHAAHAAAGTIATDAGRIHTLFRPRESDPASEALPVIWERWDDFVAHADKLASAAKAIDATSAETLAVGFRPMAGACKSCHDNYRMDD
ncbi:c-type cytochrome [Haematobacter genomosp. 1]|uniref:c-type cytochrome n=1 Tax=Haematobacter genomosp. 1 TaxID=366618 RepID=UPI0015C62035|nr:cytochrome c [Haematobacter genomosp. 1]